jgi:hypothetical protein
METITLKQPISDDVRPGRSAQESSQVPRSVAPETGFAGLSQQHPTQVIRIGVARAPSRWLKPSVR